MLLTSPDCRPVHAVSLCITSILIHSRLPGHSTHTHTPLGPASKYLASILHFDQGPLELALLPSPFFVSLHQGTVSCLQIRKTLFDMMSTPTGYGVDVGMAANTISSLRGNVSAMASGTTPPNYADEGITTVSSLDKQVSQFLHKALFPTQSSY